MSNTFRIDIKRWALLLLPTALRKKTLFRLICAMLAPLMRIYDSFYSRRGNNIIYARCDSSYGNIQRMLNTLFPSGQGSISVVPAVTTDVAYDKRYVTTLRTATGAAFVGDSYIDRAIAQKLFDVILPSDLAADSEKKAQIANIVGRYALPGYGFNIY